MFTVRLNADSAPLVCAKVEYKNESFDIMFFELDEWNSFELADGNIYDIHLLYEDLDHLSTEDLGFQVSIYSVHKTYETDVHNGLELEMLEVDTSDEGQQLVTLLLEGEVFGDK